MKKPPKHLSRAAARWLVELRDEYDLTDSGGWALAVQAAECWQRCGEAREIVSSQGAIVLDRFGSPREHPAVKIEYAARSQLLAALKLLNLDIEPLAKRSGRPGGDFHFGGG